ncbi:hypothetical protein TNCV_47211 [Trichonephila clavipes]|nr:hypothetical protein TNCV_47211 [Trichonephila clavipes]
MNSSQHRCMNQAPFARRNNDRCSVSLEGVASSGRYVAGSTSIPNSLSPMARGTPHLPRVLRSHFAMHGIYLTTTQV